MFKKVVISIVTCFILFISSQTVFADLGGVPDNTDPKGVWMVSSATDKTTLFIPGSTLFNIVTVDGETLIIISRLDNMKWTYAFAVVEDDQSLTIDSMASMDPKVAGFTDIDANYSVISENHAQFVINKCIVYDDELCAQNDTVLDLVRLQEPNDMLPDDDSKGLWVVTSSTDNTTLFVPGKTIVNIVEIQDIKYVLMSRIDNMAWTYGIGIENSDKSLTISAGSGFRIFDADFFTVSHNKAMYILHTCIMTNLQSCSKNETVLNLNRIQE